MSRMVVVLGVLLVFAAALGAGQPGLFLIDDSSVPKVTVSWVCRDGQEVLREGSREYADPGRKTILADNLLCYAAVGGTRLDAGLADPRGGIVRVGFYKVDGRSPMFPEIAPGTSVTITLRGVRFNQPASPRLKSGFMHAKFDDPVSVLGCNDSAGLSAKNSLLDLYNTADPGESLSGRITARNGRPGVLAPEHATSSVAKGPMDAGSITLTTEADGSITMVAVVPYALFKHPDDPWLRSNPGDFVEPFHFHIEFECLPAGASDSEPSKTPG
ncbi:MAG: hypothetical protein KF745_15200 [Phycisphaeraceae bacterium]|nr:hypothetical protein [Phycisphaeraceae bacterium]